MSISTLTTWAVGQTISLDVDYTVGIYIINGIPIRCLFNQTSKIPCAIILHVLGYGDWIYFHNFTPIKKNSRVLNHWQTYQGKTIKETQEVHQLLISKLYYAKSIMKKINAE
jgi:hypothetical protein